MPSKGKLKVYFKFSTFPALFTIWERVRLYFLLRLIVLFYYLCGKFVYVIYAGKFHIH